MLSCMPVELPAILFFDYFYIRAYHYQFELNFNFNQRNDTGRNAYNLVCQAGAAGGIRNKLKSRRHG